MNKEKKEPKKTSSIYELIRKEKYIAQFKELIEETTKTGKVSFTKIKKFFDPEVLNGAKFSLIENFLNNRGILLKRRVRGPNSANSNLAKKQKKLAKKLKNEIKTSDPVRMYLKEMGSVELLTREGEIELSKQMEEGKRKIIESVFEFPFTYKYFANCKKDILDKKILIRQIVDLEKFYTKNISKKIPVTIDDASLNEESAKLDDSNKEEDANTDEQNVTENKKKDAKDQNQKNKKVSIEKIDEENFTISLMESKIEPKIFTILNYIEKIYPKASKIFNERRLLLNKSKELSPLKLKKYNDYKKKLTNYLEKACCNEECISFFILTINDFNKKLLEPEGALLRMALSSGIDRKDFIKEYYENEINSAWLSKVSKKDKNWN